MLALYNKGMFVRKSQKWLESYGQLESNKRDSAISTIGRIVEVASYREHGHWVTVYTIKWASGRTTVLRPDSIIGLTEKETFQYKLGNLK